MHLHLVRTERATKNNLTIHVKGVKNLFKVSKVLVLAGLPSLKKVAEEIVLILTTTIYRQSSQDNSLPDIDANVGPIFKKDNKNVTYLVTYSLYPARHAGHVYHYLCLYGSNKVVLTMTSQRYL